METPTQPSKRVEEKPESYWNYRVVAEYDWHEKEVLRGWSFTIRGVHYKDHGKTISGWDADPMHPLGADKVQELFEDIEMMSKAMYRPLLIRQKNKLIEYPRKIYLSVTPKMLKNYECNNNAI